MYPDGPYFEIWPKAKVGVPVFTGKKYRGGKDAPKATKRKATGSPTASTSTQ